MIYVDELLLNTTIYEIMQELKFATALNGQRLFNIIRDINDDIVTNCPFHKDGQERRPSFGVHKSTGVCHCFTCGYSASLSEMISNVFGKNDGGLYGHEWLKRNFTSVQIEERADISLDVSRNKKEKKYISDEEYDKFRYIHPYMYKRGLTDEIIERYDIGYDRETNSITFPCRDISGRICYIARRSVATKWFSYPSGTEKLVYGIYEFNKYFPDNTELVVCESIFNSLSLVGCGIPSVALNGTGSANQLKCLEALPIRSLVLALDPDDAGRHGAEKIAERFKKRFMVYEYDYKDGRDINDLYLAGEVPELIKTKHLYFS